MRRFALMSWCAVALIGMGADARAAVAPSAIDDLNAAEAAQHPAQDEPPPDKPQEPPLRPQAADPTPQAANPLWAIPLSALSITRDRPLFTASRRAPQAPAMSLPVVEAVLPQAPPEPDRPRLALVGTVIADEERFGIFVDQATNQSLRLKVGDQHEGWTLRDVIGREATLEKDRLVARLAMPEPGRAVEGDVVVTPIVRAADKNERRGRRPR